MTDLASLFGVPEYDRGAISNPSTTASQPAPHVVETVEHEETAPRLSGGLTPHGRGGSTFTGAAEGWRGDMNTAAELHRKAVRSERDKVRSLSDFDGALLRKGQPYAVQTEQAND